MAAINSIKIAKVEGAQLLKRGQSYQGTLHLTAHHLIFKHDGSTEELWVPYPLLSVVTRQPQTLVGLNPIALRTRTFDFFSLSFSDESSASDVYETIRDLTAVASVTQFYAFFYNPPDVDTSSLDNGWDIYVPEKEFTRMGVGSRTKAWRFTEVNKDYTFCPTYPSRMVVPAKISDATLAYASKYRSKARIPILAYLHWANYGTITRSSQPMVGLTNSRSIQDEKLIEAIFQSHLSPESSNPPSTDTRTRIRPLVYGATATNLIIDARPTANAMVNVGKGGGTENMENYKDGRKAYLGVDNIHSMRDSLTKVVEVLREADSLSEHLDSATAPSLLDRQALRRSGWLRHLSAILDGTLLIVRNVHVNSSHVLIHCSDGWDRTAQLSSLAQISLDPFYRTIRGFQVLIEKDWLSFGHKFTDRCGHLSVDKQFHSSPDGGEAPQAQAQAFLASVQNKFAGLSHLREKSPVFHQFLECVWQLQRQFPHRFEFNGAFLERIHYHLYSCQFGTFLFNTERERRSPSEDDSQPYCQRTRSVWEWFNADGQKNLWLNELYDSSLDDRKTKDMGVLICDPKDVRFWHQLYGRSDDEMNGRAITTGLTGSDLAIEEDPSTDSSLENALPQLPVNYVSRKPRHLTGDSQVPFTSSSPSPTRSYASQPASTAPASSSLHSIPISADTSSGPSFVGAFTASSGGMKSMWGKLSSNANAAFSAVSEVARDFGQGMSSSTGGLGSEMAEVPAPLRQRSWSGADPGAVPRQDDVRISSLTDNPWSSIRQTERTFKPLPLQPVLGSSPAVGQPSISPTASEPPPSILPLHVSPRLTPVKKPLAASPEYGDKDVDPLGVGLS